MCFVVKNSPVGVNIKDKNYSSQDQGQRAQHKHGYLPAHP